MKRFLNSEIGAAVKWVFASMLMAAVIAPWLYQVGKHFAATAETRELPHLLEWLGDSCRRAKFGRYYDRAMMFSALCFLPLLFRRVKRIRAAAGCRNPDPKTRFAGKTIALQILAGCVIAGGILWALGMSLDACGAFAPESNPPGASRIFSKVILPAIGASLLEEWLFRGVLLGLWLRSARPAVACIGTSLLFAFLHFLQPPVAISNPTHTFAGFELLGKILLHFTEPRFFVTDFATLTAVGLILAWARVRTGALWFSIGLHSGWILAFQAFGLFYQRVPGSPWRPWGVGDNLRSGILPMLTLGLTALVCHFVMRRFADARLTAHHRHHEDPAETSAAEG